MGCAHRRGSDGRSRYRRIGCCGLRARPLSRLRVHDLPSHGDRGQHHPEHFRHGRAELHDGDQSLPRQAAAQSGDAERREPPQGRRDRGARCLFRAHQTTRGGETMTDLTRRRFTALAGASLLSAAPLFAGGQRLPYDRLVVAPGIDIKWDSVPGYSEAAAEAMPHAWKPGAQTELLVKKLNAVNDGDTIVMVCPPNPYRCPPGPYERVS